MAWIALYWNLMETEWRPIMIFYYKGHKYAYDPATKIARRDGVAYRWAAMSEDMRYAIQCASI